MAIIAQVYPTMPTRSCRFCLSLQDGSVFADFDIDDEGQVYLLRISFDGYGCCSVVGGFNKMNPDDSRLLISAVERGMIEDPKIEAVLRTYLEHNSDRIWRDALVSHGLLSGSDQSHE